MRNDKIKQLYDALKADGGDVGSEQEFESWFLAPGEQGYNNRKYVYDTFKADGGDVGESYDEFRDWLGLHVHQPSNQDFTMSESELEGKPSGEQRGTTSKHQQPQQPREQSQPQRIGNIPTVADVMDNRPTYQPKPVFETEVVTDEEGNRVRRPKLQPTFAAGRMQEVPVVRDVMGNEYDPTDESVQDEVRRQTRLDMPNVKQANREQVASLSQEVDDRLSALTENVRKQTDPTNYMRYTIATGGKTLETEAPGYKELQSARRSLRDAQRIIDEADKAVNENKYDGWLKQWTIDFAGGAVRGFGQKLFDVETWDMGESDLSDAGAFMKALNDAENGKPLTEEQRIMLDAKAVEMATNAYFGSYVGRGYKAGEVTGESLPFMLEMMINPASTLGTSAQSKLARYALKRFSKKIGIKAAEEMTEKGLMREAINVAGKKAVKKAVLPYSIGGRVIGDVGASAILTSTTGSVGVAADAINRMNGQVEYVPDMEGKSVFAGVSNQKEFGTALKEAFLSRTIENHSEMLGEYFAPVLGVVGKGVGKGLSKIGLDGVNKFVDNIAASDLARLVTDFEKRAKWSGTIGEYAEEVVGGIENAILVGDQTLDTDKDTGVFNLDNNINTFLGVSLLGGVMSSVKTIGYMSSKYRMRSEMENADKVASSIFANQDKWEQIRNTITVGSDEDIKAVLAEVRNDDSLTQDQKIAAFKYAQFAMQYRGALIADEKRHSEEPNSIQTDVETSFDNGYTLEGQEMNDAKNNLDLQRQRIEEIANDEMLRQLDEEPIESLAFIATNEDWSEEEKQIALDYVNAKATYDGMLQKVTDDIDGRIAESDGIIGERVSKTDGMIHPAILKAENKQVYIVDGNVQMLPDGTMVDAEKSDGSIIVRDAETGELSFVTPSDFMSVDEAIDAEEEAEAARNTIREQVAQQAADKIEGVLPFNDGDQYTVLDDEGQQHTIEVVPNPDADASGAVAEGSVLVSVDGAYVPQVMLKEEVQRMHEAYNLARLAENEKEKEAKRAEETAMQSQQTEQKEGAQQTEEGGAGGEASPEQTGANEPSAATADNAMPMIGEGEDAEPDFMAVTPERAHSYLYNEAGLSRDEANQFVEANKKAADKELEKAKKGKPTMGTSLARYKREQSEYQQKVDAAQQVADYWQQVKDAQQRVLASELDARAAEDAANIAQAKQEEQLRQEEELRKQAAQAALGTNNVAPAIREKWDAAPKVEGARNEIVLANGERVPGRYYLVESGAATPSHNPRAEFSKNEGYPVDENGQSVNDRDYERDKDAQTITRQIADNYDQRAAQSPVVVSKDGIVMSGNGRTMAGELAAAHNTDGAYIDYLTNYGSQYGFTPEQVGSMAHPRVVFVPDADMPYNAETYAKFNQQEMKGQSKTEQAVKLGKIVDDNAFGRIIRSINKFDTLGDFYNDANASTQAIGELLAAGAISQAQYAEMFDGDAISAQGREILENMLIGKAFESNPDAVRQITSIRSMRQSVITALAEISNNLTLGEDYSVESELSQAIALVYEARKNGNYKFGDKVSVYARQGNLFAFDEGATVADYSNPRIMMLADVINDSRVTRLKKWLIVYNNAAQDSANGQIDLFTGDVKSKDDIINEVKQLLNYGTEEEQQAAIEGAINARTEGTQEAGTGSTGNEGNGVEAGPYTNEALLSNSSEMHLAEQQDAVPDLLPTQENNVSDGKGTEKSDNVQENSEKTLPKSEKKEGENAEANASETVAGGETAIDKQAQEFMDAYKKWGEDVHDDALYKAYEDAQNRLHEQMRAMSDDELAAFNEKYGKQYGAIADEVRKEQGRRLNEALINKSFEDGLQAQGEITGTAKAPKVATDSFTANDETRQVLNGVYHDESGYAVATDGRLLVADKSQYDEGNKGKIVASHKVGDYKKGDVIPGNYPKWRMVVDGMEGSNTASVAWDGLRNFLAGAEEQLKARWKAEKESNGTKQSFASWSEPAIVAVRMPNGEICVYNYGMLRAFSDAAASMGMSEITYGAEKPLKATNDKGIVMLMPVNPTAIAEEEFGHENEGRRLYYEWGGAEKAQTSKPAADAAGTVAKPAEEAAATTAEGTAAGKPAARRTRASKVGKIDDFGEKIGGARKDVARGRIRDTKKMTVKDLTTLKKGADDILSQTNIMRLYKDGQMDEQTARGFMALNNAAKVAMKHASPTGRELIMTKYRDAAVAWEEGKPVVFEVTDEDVKAYQSQFGVQVTDEKARESLDYLITDPYNMFMQTYEAIDYPAVERKLGQYVIVDYTSMNGRHYVPSRPYWVKNGLRAQRGYPFGTMESAVAELKKLCPEVTEKEKKARGEKAEHGLHVTKEGYGFYIKSRNIPGNIYLSPKFFTEKEAQKYLDDNLERLKEREQRLVDALMGSNIGMAEREGVDYRNGKDVTPQDFLDEFGFRGVEFGNWVPQGERQMYLNKTYDAIKDFCAIVGISPRAFSLGGRLGLAFGARGKSRAMAHYEPGKEVINLTRMSGVGSLAHEWFHALDNYLAKQKTGNMSDMATETHDVVREELGDVFKEMFRAMRALDYDKRSRRAGEYWGRTVEEFARLFENYIYNKLSAKETTSPVLVREDVLLDNIGEDLKNSWPYPSAEENAKMEPYFDKLFDTIQEKTDANGNVVLFQKVDGSTIAREADAAEEALRDEVIRLMREAGIEVSTDWEEGQSVLDAYRELVMLMGGGKKKTTSETAKAQSPEGEQAYITDISDADSGAKVIKNIEKLAKDYEKKSNQPRTFLEDVAEAIGAVGRVSKSKYLKFKAKNGRIVVLRLANHNASVRNFDNNNEEEGVSIVVSGTDNNGVENNGLAHLVEFFYQEKDLRKADGKPLVEIIRSIEQMLYSGEYKDTTGLAKAEEVNADTIREMRAYHGSGADFDAFDHSFIGTGEGNQAFGWGTYVSDVEGVGRGYAKRIGDIKISERNYIESKIEEAKRYNIPAQVEYWENELKRNNLENAQHYLYEVEIPEDNGSNYIDYFAKMRDQQGILDKVDDYMTNNEVYGFRWERQNPDERIQFRAGSRLITLTPNQSGADLYEEFKDAFGAKPASEILHAMGITGIKVPVNAMRGGNENGEMNYVIFDENDLNITDKIKFFRTSNGEAYGFTLNGKIYLDPRIATSETPIHEYAHLWAQALRQANPEAWEKLKDEMRNEQDVMDYVKRLYPEITDEDELLEEVFTHYSGKRGAERLRNEMREEMAKANGIIDKARAATVFAKLRDMLSRFWNMARDLFAGKNENLANMKGEDFADMMMNDLMSGFRPAADATGTVAARDMEYADAANARDTEKAQKMVDEAARKAMPNTKIVDEDGNPLAVYHGTTEHFTVFDRTKGRANMDIQGMFFSPWELDAKGYGQNVRKFYVNITNPASFGEALSALRRFQGQENAGVKAREYLISKGYDGVNNDNEEYIAFFPEQIKSADAFTYDDAGNLIPLSRRFDESNNDIRYQFAGEQGAAEADRTEGRYNELNERYHGKPVLFIRLDDVSDEELFRDIGATAEELEGKTPEELHEEAEKIKEDARKRKCVGGYSPSNRKITIFADNIPLHRVEEFFFHENIHGILHDWYEDELRSIAERFYDVAPKDGDIIKWSFIEKGYNDKTDAQKKEEFFTYWLSRAMVNGRVGEMLDMLSSEDAERVNNILNAIGYDRRTEEPARKSQAEENTLADLGGVQEEQLRSGGRGEEPQGESRTLERDGAQQLSYEESLAASRAAGYTKRQHDAWWNRRQRGKRNMAEDMAAKMHLTDRVTIVDSADELDGMGFENLTDEDRQSKGWFDPKTGKIVMILGNHASPHDVLQTMLHEGVNHYGLRELFGKNFLQFLDNVYEHATPEIRRKIAELSAKYGFNIRTATEEYLGKLAEETDFENADKQGWWHEIKMLFFDMLHSIGLSSYGGAEISDNELRYILWRSYKNLTEPGSYRNLFDVAADVVMQEKLGVGRFEKPAADAARTEAAEPAGIDLNDIEKIVAEPEADGFVGGVGIYLTMKDGNTYHIWVETDEENGDEEYLGTTEFYGNEDEDIPGEEMTKRFGKFFGEHVNTIFGTRLGELLTSKRTQRNGITLDSKDIAAYNNVNTKANPDGEASDTATDQQRMAKMLKDIKRKHPDAFILFKGSDGFYYPLDQKELEKVAGVTSFAPRALDEVMMQLIRSGKRVALIDDIPSAAERRLHRPGQKALARDTYERLVASGSEQFAEAVQDSMRSLKNLYKAITDAEGNKKHIRDVAGYENAYLAENRMHSASQAQIAAWEHDFIKPIVQEVYDLVGDDAEAYDALIDYMMAKHGLERNRVLAERDAQAEAAAGNGDYNDLLSQFREKDYAGLTALTGEADVAAAEAAAQQMVDDYEASHYTAELWKKVNAATKSSLEKLFRSGMMSKERYEKIRDMFEYYIPLQGFDETVAEDVYAYMGSDGTRLYGTPIRTAKGRKSKADDPLATIQMNGEAAIRQGNRNEMKQTFLNFVQNHPSDLVSVSDVWLRYNDVTDEWEQYFDAGLRDGDTAADVARKVEAFEQRMEQLAQSDPDHYKRGSDMKDVPFRVLTSRDMAQHQVMVRRGGKTYVLTINGNPRAAQALNGMTNPDVFTEGVFGKAMNFGQQANRLLSALYTTRNPEFVASNYTRDMLYSNCMTWVKESPSYALKFHKNFGMCNPATMGKLFVAWENGSLRKSVENGSANDMQRQFYDFMMNGGETGWTSLRDIEQHKKDLEAAIRREGNTSKKAWKAIGGAFDIVNRAVENSARFAAFLTSREMGRSLERSIYDAKEVSVNFNKKGSGDKFLSSQGQTKLGKLGATLGGSGRGLYVFFNAGVQGLSNIAGATKEHPFKAAGIVMAPFFMLGAIMPIIGEIVSGGGDDDDDYYNLPEYVRRNNIVFRFGKDKPWVKIPLPIEFRAMYGLGELACGVLRGKERYSNEELAKQFISQISQVLPLDFMEGGGGWHAFIPSQIKPVVEAYSNISWIGLPIYRDNKFKPYAPQWTLAYDNTDKTLVAMTRWLNEATGGSDVSQGWIDWNPARIEYMLKGYLGGYYTMYDRLKKTAETAFGEREFEWRNIPVASRFLHEGDERTSARKAKSEYFDLLKEYDETKSHLNDFKKIADSRREDAFEYAKRIDFLHNSKEYTHYQIIDNYKPLLDAYHDMAKDAEGEEKKKIQEEEDMLRRECIDLIHAVDDGKEIDTDAYIESSMERMYGSWRSDIRKKAGSIIAKGLGGTDYYGSGSATSTEYGKAYDMMREKSDLEDDVRMQVEVRKAKEGGNKNRESALESSRRAMNDVKKYLSSGADQHQVMEDIRRLRKYALELPEEISDDELEEIKANIKESKDEMIDEYGVE